jgi:hypothetical protein
VNGTMVEGAVAIIMTSGNVSPRFATITGQRGIDRSAAG